MPKGYRLPEVIGGYVIDHICLPYPDNEEYRRALWGALFQLARWWSWERTGDDKAKQAAEYWLSILNPAYHAWIDGNRCIVDIRQHPTNFCLLQYSSDGGNTWHDGFDYSLCLDQIGFGTSTQITIETQINTYITYIENLYDNNIFNICPGMDYDGTARDEDRDAALCNALNWLVNSTVQAALAFAKEKYEKGQVVPKLAAIALTGAAAVASIVAAPLTGGALFMAAGAAIAGAAIGLWTLLDEGDFSAFEDVDAIESVVCYMFTSMSLTDPSQTWFENALDGNTFTGNAAVIAESVAAALDDFDTFLLFADYLEKSLALIDAGFDLYCPCGVGWTIDHDMLVSDNGWLPVVGGDGYTRARWLDGLGWTSTNDNAIVRDEVRITREWTNAATWTRVDVYFSNCSALANNFVQIPLGGTADFFTPSGSPATISLYRYGASIRIDMTLAAQTLNCLYIERVVMHGLGSAPS